MNVKTLIKQLKKLNPNLEVRVFAQDHNPYDEFSGIGSPSYVKEIENDVLGKFVCLHT